MNKKVKTLAGAAVAAVVLLVVWTVTTLPDVPDENAQQPRRVMSYNNNKTFETKNDKVSWELTADSIEMDADSQDASMTNVKCVFYAEDGRVLTLVGDKGVYSDNTKRITMEGNIKADSTDGSHMRCEKAEYASEDEILKLIGNAQLESESDKLKASGDVLESSDGFSRFKATGKAHVEKGK